MLTAKEFVENLCAKGEIETYEERDRAKALEPYLGKRWFKKNVPANLDQLLAEFENNTFMAEKQVANKIKRASDKKLGQELAKNADQITRKRMGLNRV